MTEGERLDWTTERIVGAAIKVHGALGPGLLESAYQAALALELEAAGLEAEQQKPLSMVYRGLVLEAAYRIDFLVQKEVVLEIKAVDVSRLRNGIHRVVNGYPESEASLRPLPPPRSLRARDPLS